MLSSRSLRFNEHLEGDGPTVFAHACKMGLEGVVSKRKDSPYRSRRSPDWLKMKNLAAPAVTREAEEDWGNSAIGASRCSLDLVRALSTAPAPALAGAFLEGIRKAPPRLEHRGGGFFAAGAANSEFHPSAPGHP